MQSSPDLFDNNAIFCHRQRALRSNFDDWILHDLIINEIKERLKEINRTFKKSIIIGWRAEEWRRALQLEAVCYQDKANLGFDEGCYDFILHSLCLHVCNDVLGHLIQMWRALKPDGLMLAVLFGGQSLYELRQVFAAVESRYRNGISPRVVPMAEIRDLGNLLHYVGFALPVVDSVKYDLSYESFAALVGDLRKMGEVNAMKDRDKSFIGKKLYTDLAVYYKQNFSNLNGRIKARAEVLFLTGWRPSPLQQQSLPPGSAQMRLKDALGSVNNKKF